MADGSTGNWMMAPLLMRGTDGLFRLAGQLGGLVPMPREGLRVEVEANVPYLPGAGREHWLDVYRPRGAVGPLPIVIYVHGGGFRILSKESHRIFAMSFARRGYLVFNINYRLAPEHPFPAAVQDASAAYCWVVGNATRYGGDVSRLILAGESAGGNLVTALTVAACFERPETCAREVFDTGVVPRATVPACGLLQVSGPERYLRREKLSPFVRARMRACCQAYLGEDYEEARAERLLADPLLILESDVESARPLPPFFAPVGTADPILDDTRRLARAIARRGGVCHAEYYPGELHAFHALVWRDQAQKCWRQTFEFLDGALASEPQSATAHARSR